MAKVIELKLVRLVVLAVALLAMSQRAYAERSAVARVGILGPPQSAATAGLLDGLMESGFVRGETLDVEIGEDKSYENYRVIATSYVEKKVDVMVTVGGTATAFAKAATREIPIVFIWGIANPVKEGLVKSLARPGTNLTGLTSFPNPEIYGKRLEFFKEAVPNLRRVVMLYNARGENPDHATSLRVVRDHAPRLGIRLDERPMTSAATAGDALVSVSKNTADGVFMIGSGLFNEACKKIVAAAMQKRLPFWGCVLEEDSFLSYSPSRYHNGFRGAWYVAKLLRHGKVNDLPVERPAKFQFTINLKTAKRIGVVVPPAVLQRADKVIQ